MTDEKDEGGCAFPLHGIDGVIDYGMSLRDFIAASALPAVIAGYLEGNGRVIGTDHILSNTSIIAYKFADAMIAARKR